MDHSTIDWDRAKVSHEKTANALAATPTGLAAATDRLHMLTYGCERLLTLLPDHAPHVP
ncbi:hypothetical protein [Streptomyces candidus]|uniref:Uncharacterized protein n=1 Tax=Streptomyces candidus TaxID=67283 RepID=A0A7X0HLP4_9ACTN|nr:hypothetical protein [Streptomyces candidus]MBB6439805.1 hypothetical protein [Streptomyces candidus]GHH57183.1 hypothetical protein GCM10018773_64190 [Streptomyces candidus]